MEFPLHEALNTADPKPDADGHQADREKNATPVRFNALAQTPSPTPCSIFPVITRRSRAWHKKPALL